MYTSKNFYNIDTTYFISDLHLESQDFLKQNKESLPPDITVDSYYAFLRDRIKLSIIKEQPDLTKVDLFIIGDLSCKYNYRLYCFIKSFPFHVHLLKGNHDNMYPSEHFKNGFYHYKDIVYRYTDMFMSISNLANISIQDSVSGKIYPVTLCHYPLQAWYKQYYGAIHLYGHMHNDSMPVILPNSYNTFSANQDFIPRTLRYYISKNKEQKYIKE